MAIDPSIAMGFRPPNLDNSNRLAQMMAMDQADRQNRLADLQIANAGKVQADENKLSQMFIDAKGDPAAVSQAMYGGGFYKQGMAFDKANAEAKSAKTTGDSASLKLNMELGAAFVQGTNGVNSQETWDAAIEAGRNSGIPELAEKWSKANPVYNAQELEANRMKIIPALEQWKNSEGIKADKVKAGAEEGTPVDVMRGGKPVKIMSKGGRVLGDAVPSKGLTVNVGQGKPMPAAALRMQQEELDAIGSFAGINADMTAIESQIKGGKLEFGPVNNLTARARNMAGMSNEQSVNFASFQSTMEKMRNASLLLNKGVQTDGDAQRAWNELFANINDKGVVTQRLAEIKKINERAVNIRKMNVDQIRSNYRAEPLDTAGYENQGAALGGEQPGATQPGRTQSGATTSGW